MSLSFDHLDQIAASVRQQVDPRVPLSELTTGDMVRHAGDWWDVVLIGTEHMRLRSEDGRVEVVECGHGETWLRWEGGF